MAGIPITPDVDPDEANRYAATGGEFVPQPGATFFYLTKNGVELTQDKYESWAFANNAAAALNNGADDIDKNAWGVSGAKTA